MKVIDDDDGDGDDFDDDERKKSKKKPTLAQTIDQVVTIKTHTESSKTELSSGGKRPFKVWRFFSNFVQKLPKKHPSILRNIIFIDPRSGQSL